MCSKLTTKYVILVLIFSLALPTLAYAHSQHVGFSGARYHAQQDAKIRRYEAKYGGRELTPLYEDMRDAGWPMDNKALVDQAFHVAAGEAGLYNSHGHGQSIKHKKVHVGKKHKTIHVKYNPGCNGYFQCLEGAYGKDKANRVKNCFQALKKFQKSGWQPWTVAHKLGYCR